MKNFAFCIVCLWSIIAVLFPVGFAETGSSILAEIQRIEELMQPTTTQPITTTFQQNYWKNETYGSYFYAKKSTSHSVPQAADGGNTTDKSGVINYVNSGVNLNALIDYTYRGQLKVINNLQYQFALTKFEAIELEQKLNDARLSSSGRSRQVIVLLHKPSLETKLVYHQPSWGLNAGAYLHATYLASQPKIQAKTVEGDQDSDYLLFCGMASKSKLKGQSNSGFEVKKKSNSCSSEAGYQHHIGVELGIVAEIKDIALKVRIDETQLRAEPNLILKLAYLNKRSLKLNKNELTLLLFRAVLGGKFAIDFSLSKEKNLSISVPLQLTYAVGLVKPIYVPDEWAPAFYDTESDFRIGLLVEADLTRSVKLAAGYEFKYILSEIDTYFYRHSDFTRNKLMVHSFRFHLSTEF